MMIDVEDSKKMMIDVEVTIIIGQLLQTGLLEDEVDEIEDEVDLIKNIVDFSTIFFLQKIKEVFRPPFASQKSPLAPPPPKLPPPDSTAPPSGIPHRITTARTIAPIATVKAITKP